MTLIVVFIAVVVFRFVTASLYYSQPTLFLTDHSIQKQNEYG
jgi:hypothetical protein